MPTRLLLVVAVPLLSFLSGPSALADITTPNSPAVPPSGTTASVSSSALGERPSGLVQSGDSKTACIDAGLGAPLRGAELSTGLTYNCLETFSDAAPTWADWVSPWLTHVQYGYSQWLAADPTTRSIILTQDLIPSNEATDPNWRAREAAGDFNKYARLLARNLIATGFGYSVIRLGHEMNGTWVDDNIGNTKNEWHQWAMAFAQIVRTMQSVPGAHFLFDWDVNAGTRPIPLSDYYPGDRYVDIVGIDFYDSGGGNQVPSATHAGQRWAVLTQQPLGLDAVEAFAKQHDKPVSIPEWGTVRVEDTPTAGGDDGAYVARIGGFIASHDVAYESWFDSGSDGIYQLNRAQAPHSLAAYIRTISKAKT